MNTKTTKVNMNKIIVLISAFLVLVVLTVVINSFSKYANSSDKKISSSKNEYASSNKVLMNNEANSNETEKELEKKEVVSEVVYNQPVIVETKQVNNETILYFEDAEKEIISLVENDDDKLSTKIKEKFVELVDFIFYGTEINGITFDELTEETKQKLVSIVNRIDAKIEEKVPGYKETISSGAKESYTFLVGKLKQGISYLDGKVEEKIGTEKYNEIKENISETTGKIKESGSVVVEKGKEILGTAKDKIKNWYEGWK